MKQKVRGSLSTMFAGENTAQPVVIVNKTIKGTSGRKDSQNVGCFGVLHEQTLYRVTGADIPKLPTEISMHTICYV